MLLAGANCCQLTWFWWVTLNVLFVVRILFTLKFDYNGLLLSIYDGGVTTPNNSIGKLAKELFNGGEVQLYSRPSMATGFLPDRHGQEWAYIFSIVNKVPEQLIWFHYLAMIDTWHRLNFYQSYYFQAIIVWWLTIFVLEISKNIFGKVAWNLFYHFSRLIRQ